MEGKSERRNSTERDRFEEALLRSESLTDRVGEDLPEPADGVPPEAWDESERREPLPRVRHGKSLERSLHQGEAIEGAIKALPEEG